MTFEPEEEEEEDEDELIVSGRPDEDQYEAAVEDPKIVVKPVVMLLTIRAENPNFAQTFVPTM